MLATYPCRKLPLPDHVVVFRGNWCNRANLEYALAHLDAKIASKNITRWERKFSVTRAEQIRNALA
jgi:hypothetical protein